MLERARSWVAADVGYSGSNYFTNEYGTYRTDCSGYVSMAWGLGSSYTTVTLPSVSYPIAKDALEPGDILNNPLPGTSGHVVLFAGWADDTRTEYYAYEESPSGGAHLSQIPYPYWPGYGTFTPRRYVGTTSSTPPPVTVPEPPKEPAPLKDGDYIRHDGQVYRIAGGAPMAVTTKEKARKVTDAEMAELPTQPADGTFLRVDGDTFVVAGGAPVFVPGGAKDAVRVEQAAVDAVLHDKPADGTMVRTPNGELYVFAGGAPIHVDAGLVEGAAAQAHPRRGRAGGPRPGRRAQRVVARAQRPRRRHPAQGRRRRLPRRGRRAGPRLRHPRGPDRPGGDRQGRRTRAVVTPGGGLTRSPGDVLTPHVSLLHQKARPPSREG
jgi:hypothetical protein